MSAAALAAGRLATTIRPPSEVLMGGVLAWQVRVPGLRVPSVDGYVEPDHLIWPHAALEFISEEPPMSRASCSVCTLDECACASIFEFQVGENVLIGRHLIESLGSNADLLGDCLLIINNQTILRIEERVLRRTQPWYKAGGNYWPESALQRPNGDPPLEEVRRVLVESGVLREVRRAATPMPKPNASPQPKLREAPQEATRFTLLEVD
jgi:hypothetical protein